MTLRTADEYREGLRDGRRVIYRGRPVADVTEFEEFDGAIAHSAHAYSIADTRPRLSRVPRTPRTPLS